MSESLEHYGVLGMKWGIRRYQPYPVGKHGKFTGKIENKSRKFAGQDHNQDIVVKAGSNVYRVQNRPKVSKGKKAVYITLDGKSALNYVNMEMNPDANKLPGTDATKDVRVVKMKIPNDLVIPSYNKTIETFIKTMNEETKGEWLTKDKNGKYVFRKSIMSRGQDFLADEWDNAKTLKDVSKLYIESLDSLMANKKTRDAFFKNLSDQGYNAIVDEVDASGRFSMGSSTIVFSGKSLKTVDNKKIPKDGADFLEKLNGNSMFGDYSRNDIKAARESKEGQEWLKYLEIEKKK